MSTPDGAAQHAAAAADPRRWAALVAVCVATFMLLLDITIVNVALPDIARDLHAGFDDLQWVIDAYALSLATFTLTMGSLADRFGRRRVFVVGLALFTIASALCGLASSSLLLILARGLQGIGGAAMFATSLALLAANFSGRERATAFAIWGATIGGAVAIGPLVGGVLVDGLSWPWIFYVNLPIGVLAIVGALARVPESSNPHAGRIDVPGLVTWVVALSALVFALVRGNSLGWGSTSILAALAIGSASLIAFLVIERRTGEPMLDLSLFGRATFTGAQIAALSISASMFAMFLYLTLYIQNGLGFSPLQAGLRFLPITLGSFVVAASAGKLAGRFSPRALIGSGLLLVGAGLLLMRGLDASSKWTALLPGFLIAGAGIGFVNPALAAVATGAVEPWRAGIASGINSTFRQVGIATGTAALGAIFESRLAGHLSDAFAQAGPAVRQASQNVPETVFQTGSAGPLARVPGGQEAVLTAFSGTLDDVLLVAAIVALAGALLCTLLIRPSDLAGAPAETAPGQEPLAEPAT